MYGNTAFLMYILQKKFFESMLVILRCKHCISSDEQKDSIIEFHMVLIDGNIITTMYGQKKMKSRC